MGAELPDETPLATLHNYRDNPAWFALMSSLDGQGSLVTRMIGDWRRATWGKVDTVGDIRKISFEAMCSLVGDRVSVFLIVAFAAAVQGDFRQ